MKFKEINNNKVYSLTRANYLYNNYCIDKTLDAQSFIETIKTAYYKYDALVYNIGYSELLKEPFVKVFKQLPRGYNIVDIGGGTGETFTLVKNTGYEYKKYFFIEPFKAMSDQFKYKQNDNVEIINNYFESTKQFEDENVPTIYIVCGVLRTMDQLSFFLENVKLRMKKDDILFLPIEPNNNYFANQYNLLKPFLFSKRVLNKLKRVWGSLPRTKKVRDSNKLMLHPLEQALKYLKDSNKVNNDFTTQMLYAVVYYNNYLLWKDINVPEEYNDGFFTIKQVASAIDCQIEFFDTWSYFYSLNFIQGEKVMHKLFPKSGASFSAVLRRY